jgi:hypothetical protein
MALRTLLSVSDYGGSIKDLEVWDREWAVYGGFLGRLFRKAFSRGKVSSAMAQFFLKAYLKSAASFSEKGARMTAFPC